MAQPRRKKTTTTPRSRGMVALYAAYALVFVVVAFYTVLHLVFFGFTGEPVGVDLGLALVLPLLWIVGLLRVVALRATPRTAKIWGWIVLGVLVVILIADTVRFTPILWG